MNRWLGSKRLGAEEYDRRFAEAEREGRDMHGEASFVASLGVRSVLDGGCGTGRVAIELARRGVEVVGVDLDEDMLAAARRKAPHLDWRVGDLATVDLLRHFEAVVLAGNVMIFLAPGTEAAVVANMARHLLPGGALVSGFQLDRELELAAYDEHCRRAGLALAGRWATWEGAPWTGQGDYAVSLHRLVPPGAVSVPGT